MIARTTPRGQPLLVLGLLLGGWVLLRASLWDAPAAPSRVGEPYRVLARQNGATAAGPEVALAQITPSVPGWSIAAVPIGRSVGKAMDRALPTTANPIGPGAMLVADRALPVMPKAAPGMLPPSLNAAPFQPPPHQVRPSPKRWSGDGWLLLRGEGAGNLAAGRGSYGASQVGGVLRFSVLPDSGHRPAVYLRASKAISGGGEAEAALGLSARPIAGVPLRAAAELRISETSGKAELRPAAYVVTELPQVALPLSFRGEAYAQGGYVWGDYPSAFVDGQLRVDRPVAALGGVEIRAGGGVWGGAQKGAERLDVGPGATLSFDAGRANARVSLDWRQRIVGDARPASGPALTVAVGF